VYIDDGTAGESGELRIDVDGHEYVEQEDYSYAQDGIVDSVAVETADGGHIVYTDSQHDGIADVVTEYDAAGDETQQAHYDATTGHWIDVTPGDDAPADPTDPNVQSAQAPGTITVDTTNGPVNVGPATVDTNDDGRPDTAVVHDSHGDTVLYTDSHGTGQADVATEITPGGEVVIADHTGDHEWTEVRSGHLTADGQYVTDGTGNTPFTPPVAEAPAQQPVQDVADDRHWSGWAGAFSETGSAQGVVRIDSATGQWISQN
jgi:hypothetical protein